VIHVAVATDRRYLPYCAVTVLSLFEGRGREPVTAHVLLGADVGAGDRDQLGGLGDGAGANVVLHEVDDSALSDLPAVGRFGPTVWYRACLPGLLPGEARVLYVDADTLIVDDLAGLWANDLGGSALGAVRNVVHPDLRGRATEVGVSSMGGYFNSGVLLFDLEQVRADGLLERAVEAARRAGERFSWPDQDALNVAFTGRWSAVHPRWNCMNSLRLWRPWAEEVFGRDAVEEALTSPAIVHFEGPTLNKPWHYLSWHPLTERYRATLDRTPWRGTPLDGRSLTNRIISKLPARWRIPLYVQARRLTGDLGELA
jgi:lipopolysaccharide biosynthesis glycosyltransferase